MTLQKIRDIPFPWKSIHVDTVPAEELPKGFERCVECRVLITDEGYYIDKEIYCEKCQKELVELCKREAVTEARGECEITQSPLPVLDLKTEEDCWRADSRYRNEFTNFGKLVSTLDRESLQDRILYDAIYWRTGQLIDAQLQAQEEDELDESDGEGDEFDDA
jgi:hypothetical protein